MRPDTPAALAQLKSPPLRWRILFALLAADADDGPAQVSLRDLAELTGVGAENARWVNREAGALVREGILDRFKVGGSGGNVYRIRDFDDWPSDVWRAGARPAKANIVALAEARAMRRADIFARKPRAQRPVVRAVTRALATQIAAVDQGERAATARAHARTHEHPAAAAHCLTERDISLSLERERESVRPQRLSERAETLVAAVETACGTTLAGAPLRRLAAVADASNGGFSALLDLARAPGLRSFNARIGALERLAAGGVTPEREHVRSDPRRRKLESSIRGAELAGDDELASELRAQLANLADREHEGGRQDAS